MLIVFATVTLQASSQDISGVIKDEEGKPVANITIGLLKSKDSSIIKYQLSDASGNYIFIKPGKQEYIIRATGTGFDPQYSAIFKMEDEDVPIPEIILHKKVSELQTVTVKANIPLIERKVDRLIFNIENSIAANGSSLEEVLKITPMLKVTEGGISMIGKGGLSVMIDGRMLYLSGTDLINYLRSLRSDDVSKIEIITAPPARYSASGNSGLVNIVLKKNPLLGWSGLISASYSQNIRPGMADNLTLNYQSARISSSLKLRHNARRGVIGETINIISAASRILSSYPRTTRASGIGGNFSLDYKINKRNNIGLIYDANSSSSAMYMNGTNRYQTGAVTDSTLFTNSDNKRPATTQTLNIYHDFKIDTAGKMINTSFNIFSNVPESKTNFVTASDRSPGTENVLNNSITRYKVTSIQTDVTLPYKWAKIETGAKYTYFANKSDVGYYNVVAQNNITDSSKSNQYNYNEYNIAAYISAEREINKKLSAKAGFRYEYTGVDGFSLTTHTGTKYQYGKLFPTAYLTYKLTASGTLSLNYSKRINRPSLNQINPFRLYTNLYSYYTGNPFLRPSYSHNMELSYLYKNRLYITLFGQRTLNGAGAVVTVNGSSVITTSENFLTQNSVGAYVTFNYRIFKWWESSSSISYSISKSESSIPEVLLQNGQYFDASTNNTFVLTKWLKYFLSFSYTPAYTRGNIHSAEQYYLNSGLRASLINNKFQVSASFLNAPMSRYTLFYNGFTQYTNTDYHYKTFSMSVTYLFGKQKVKGNTKRVDFKEAQRAN